MTVLALGVLALPVAGWLALVGVRSNSNRVADWLPAEYKETQELRWFRERFVADQFVIISWDGCRLAEPDSGEQDDPRIGRLTAALRDARIPGREGGPSVLAFDEVTNGRETLERLTSPPSRLTRAAARQRLSGVMIGPDGRQTCVLATLTDGATQRLHDVMQRPGGAGFHRPGQRLSPLFAALQQAGVSFDEVHLGGPPVDNVAIDDEGEKTLASLAALSGALGVAIAWWSLRSVRVTLLVFACGVTSAILALALLPLTGGSMDAVLMSMPALVYVLAVSGALHLLNYYRVAVEEHGEQQAPWVAVRHAWRPAMLCTATTACGLLSLLASDITPIRRFGAYSAAGVVASQFVLFVFLPLALTAWPWRAGKSAAFAKADPGRATWARLVRFLERRNRLVLVASGAVILGLAAGLPQLKSSVDLLKLFSPDARLIADYRWFESRLGRLVPAEIVIRFPERSRRERLRPDATVHEAVQSFTFLERLEIVHGVEETLAARYGPAGSDMIGATMSAAAFAPDAAPRGGLGRTAVRYTANQQLLAARGSLVDSGFLRDDPQTGEELWKVTVRCAAFHQGEREGIVAQLRTALTPVLRGAERASSAMAQVADAGERSVAALRVAIYTAGDCDDEARSAGRLFGGRGAKVGQLSETDSQPGDASLNALRAQDIVLPVGVAEATVVRLREAGIRVPPETDDDAPGIGVVFTGVLPIVYKAQRELLDSLVLSTWWSFATVLPMMAWVSRGLRAGLLVMLPNILPVLVVFGGMAWLRAEVDIGSMMAASIALGVAVDDTIHFLAWYREDLERLGCRSEAVVSAYQRSATPTLQAGLVNGLGLSVFAMSSFTPTHRFGLIMLAILAAGVVAELILLPALLLSPLGSVFDRRKAVASPTDTGGAGREGSAPALAFDK